MKIKETYEYIIEKMEDKSRLTFYLKKPQLDKYFESEDVIKFNNWQNEGLANYLNQELKVNNAEISSLEIIDGNLVVEAKEEAIFDFVCQKVREFYEIKEIHVTRMFGSFILLQKIDGELKAVKATPIPIKYCPLMIKLLKEVGGEYAEEILSSLQSQDTSLQTQNMCKLINEVVIKGGYFDTNRPLNSCESNVLFGASETMMSAMERGIIDCAVIVSNNLGTIITTNASNTQGAVKRMTGLFYSSPSEKLVSTAIDAKIIPVFPYTANIDQLVGVKEAIRMGYKNIAVSVASHDNYLHKEIINLELENNVNIYKFGLCSTGIKEETALIMKDYSDVIWSCASKYVKTHIDPNAIAQVGIKIPVFIMSDKGFDIVFNHLKHIDSSLTTVDKNELPQRPVFINNGGKIKVVDKSQLHSCEDCPHPCI